MVLFILPHAGGSARSYCSFKRYLSPSVKLIPMEPAGRGSRTNEAFFTTIQECADDLLKKHIDIIKNESYSFFGHSMGTILTTELVRQIQRQKLPEPEHLFLSGKSAPDKKIILPFGTNPSDEEIFSFFIENGLIPSEVTKNEDIMKMVSSILCADIRMTEKYLIFPEECTFNCDISVLYGDNDNFLKLYDIHSWEHFTNKSCSFYSFSGGHFYYSSHKEAICDIILKKLL